VKQWCRQLGWDAQQGESHLDAMLRGDLLGALISFEDEEITKEAVRRFEVFVQDRATPLLPADIRSVKLIFQIQFLFVWILK
jgi:puromycin-sensitive aminopeptidase